MDDTLHLNSSKAVELEWLAGSAWVEFIFYVNPLRVIPELLNGTSHGFSKCVNKSFCICTIFVFRQLMLFSKEITAVYAWNSSIFSSDNPFL